MDVEEDEVGEHVAVLREDPRLLPLGVDGLVAHARLQAAVAVPNLHERVARAAAVGRERRARDDVDDDGPLAARFVGDRTEFGPEDDQSIAPDAHLRGKAIGAKASRGEGEGWTNSRSLTVSTVAGVLARLPCAVQTEALRQRPVALACTCSQVARML